MHIWRKGCDVRLHIRLVHAVWHRTSSFSLMITRLNLDKGGWPKRVLSADGRIRAVIVIYDVQVLSDSGFMVIRHQAHWTEKSGKISTGTMEMWLRASRSRLDILGRRRGQNLRNSHWTMVLLWDLECSITLPRRHLKTIQVVTQTPLQHTIRIAGVTQFWSYELQHTSSEETESRWKTML